MPIDSKLPICEQCLAMDLNPRLHQPHLAGKPGTSQSVERWILRRIVFDGLLVLFEDGRYDYGEQRMIGIGLLDFLVVLIVHVERDEEIRIISMRKADSDETDLYYQNTGYF